MYIFGWTLNLNMPILKSLKHIFAVFNLDLNLNSFGQPVKLNVISSKNFKFDKRLRKSV